MDDTTFGTSGKRAHVLVYERYTMLKVEKIII